MALTDWFRKKTAEEKPVPEEKASRARHPMLKKRSYGAAQLGNLVHSWTTTAQTADQATYQNLRVLRARSRDQFEGNDYAKRFVDMVKTHVVGADGFVLQAQTIGRDGQQDTVANNAIESAWKQWQRKDTCDASQRLHFTDICRLIMGSLPTDGEVIIQRRLGAKYGVNQYAVKFIDPELLDVTFNEDLKNGNKIRFGIEFDEDDRPVRYYFKKSAVSVYLSADTQNNYTVVPAHEITHLFVVERVGQRRGVPWLSTPLLRMQMLDGYSEAALTAARIGASKAIFYTSDPEADASLTGLATLEEEGQLVDEVDPGTANILPPGVHVDSYDPTYPHSDFDNFVKTQLRSVAAGLGVSYHKLANDLENVNYSSGRLGELEDREVWKRLQTWLVESYLRPLYEDWLDLQLKLGTITVPSRNGLMPLSGAPDKYKKVSFQGRRWAWTDPMKEARANEINLNNFLTSPQRVLRDAGYDPEEIINEWDAWKTMLEQKGFRLPEQNKLTDEQGGVHADENEDD